MNKYFVTPTFVEKASAVFLTASLVMVSFLPAFAFPQVARADDAPAVLSDILINGEPLDGHCVAGEITITGSGITGHQGGPWKLDIGWGDNSTTTVDSAPNIDDAVAPNGDNDGNLDGAHEHFTFSVTGQPSTDSSGLTIFLHHAASSGNDGFFTAISQCLAAPTDGVVIVEKHVVNDDGGTAVASDFDLHLGGNNFVGSTTGTDIVLAGGSSYTLSEDAVEGYEGTIGGDCALNGSITVVAGENYLCTITNNDVAPTTGTLTLVKTVVNNNGGTATQDDFAVYIDDVESAWDTVYELLPGDYVVAENGSAEYDASVWGGDCDANGNVTVVAGESYECSITNNDLAPSLTLYKNLVQDNGGNLFHALNSFVLTALGPVTLSGTDGVTSDETFEAGSYALSENGPEGYTASNWSCEGGILEGSTLTLGLGETADCTITNDDNQVTLTVTKVVENNDGGTLGTEDFTLYVDDTPVVSGASNSLDAGTYNVSEDEVDGYIGTISGDCSADGSITMLPGGDYECVITNDDIAPGLTVIKQVTNDNGGTLDVDDFNLYVGETQVSSGVSNEFPAGEYVVSEEEVLGYTGSFSGDCDSEGNVTLEVGETKVCTIMNNDVAPKLTVIKEVINDNGGTAVASDFSLIVNATNTNPDGQFPGSADGTVVTLDAGIYGVAESIATGYGIPSFSEDCAGSISVGEEKTCTVTNDDIAPSLTLTKYVDNGEEGEANASQWTLTADGVTPISGEGSASSDETFVAGAYTLSEEGPGHYASSGWSCVINDGEPVEGNVVNLAVGDEASCSITNTFTPYDSDLSITKTVSDSTPDLNQALVFTVTVTNAGPDEVSGVSISDVLPAGLTYVSDDSSGAYDSLTGIWDVGSLADDASATLNVTVTVNDNTAGQQITNTASVSESDNADSNSENNSGSVTVTVNTPAPTPEPETSGGGGGGGGGGNAICSNGRDDDGDGLVDSADPVCHSDGNAGNPNSYIPFGNTESGGSVLGASTIGQVLGESCGLYMDKFIRSGRNNDTGQVMKLQTFLNKWMNSGLPVTGFYGPLTLKALNAFQEKYAAEVLTPWGLKGPTGIAYLTTLRQINMLECPELALQLPPLVNWSKNPNVPR